MLYQLSFLQFPKLTFLENKVIIVILFNSFNNKIIKINFLKLKLLKLK